MGQNDQQLVLDVLSAWRKRPQPPVSTLSGQPWQPEDKSVHRLPPGLGLGPGKPQRRSKPEFEPGQVVLARDRLQVEADAGGEAEEETVFQ